MCSVPGPVHTSGRESVNEPGIVAIHGAPRSGTSWLGQLFNSSPVVAYRYQPFFSYAFRGRVDELTPPKELDRFFLDLFASRDEFVLQQGAARLARDELDFPKSEPTHLVYKEVRFHHLLPHLLASAPYLKLIGLIRDPRSVLASWFKAPREFDPTWSMDEEWRHARLKNNGRIENWYGFERWKQLATLLLDMAHRYPDRCRIVRYEQLVDATKPTLDELFDFCGIRENGQTDSFISESTSRDDGDPYGVYRRAGTATQAFITSEIEQAIEREISGTRLEQFLT